MAEKKPTLTKRVTELERQMAAMESRTNSLKEAVVETNKNFTDALKKLAEICARHELSPDAHNPSIIWQRRTEAEKNRKLSEAEPGD